ncbi:hypothetical protein [Actinomyces sp. ZJ308]|uniref:hypothetical protein n=1 Tax=Actinomyces sp. ZJ308 TaxID=2708342 RepID=UPI0014237543|nr:hypothetical protein [Actinomyces sp. ZJ308]
MSLAGCSAATAPSGGASGGASSPSAQVYEFASLSNFVSKGTATAQLPQGLIDVVTKDGNQVPVTGVTFTAHKLDSSSMCAVDGAVTYASGGEVVASAPEQTKEQQATKRAKNVDEQLREEFGGATEDEIREDVEEELGEKASDAAIERETKARASELSTRRAELEQESTSSGEEKTPAQNVAAFLFPGRKDVFDNKKLSESNPERGLYMTSTSSFTIVESCATSFDDTSAATDMTFRMYDGKHRDDIAEIGITVMQDGTIGFVNNETKKYERDTSGNWLKKK